MKFNFIVDSFHSAIVIGFGVGLGVFFGNLAGVVLAGVFKGTVGALCDLYKAHKGDQK